MLDGKDIARDMGKRGGRPLKNKAKVTVINTGWGKKEDTMIPSDPRVVPY